MDTADITSTNLVELGAIGKGALPLAPPARSPAAAGVHDVAAGMYDGLRWTHRNGFHKVLEAVPASHWSEPERSGWQAVKRNALRSVWRATLGGVSYYLKYYRSRGLTDALRKLWRAPACQIEWESGLFALRAGIAAVRPAGYTNEVRVAGGSCALLVTEALEPAYTLSEFWRTVQADEDQRRQREDKAQLMERLGELIARAHQAGFEHLDMHANNILVQPTAPRRYRPAFVDLQSARLATPLGAGAVLRNLAQLNQWFRKNSGVGDRLRFLRAYLRWRNEYECEFEHGRALGLSFEELVRELSTTAERHAQRLWARRDRRLGRPGHYYVRLRLPNGWSAVAQRCCKHAQPESRASLLTLESGWWREQLRDPLRWFNPGAAQLTKASHSASVVRAVLETPGGEPLPVIIKRPLSRNWMRALRLFFARSRSARGWSLGHALLNRDLPTARPLALLERRVGPLVVDSILISEALPGAVDLDTHLRLAQERMRADEWRRHKRQLADLLARHLRRLHERGFVHRDCKAQNILVLPLADLRLFWIDMDGLRLERNVSEADRFRAMVRLHVSLSAAPGVTRTDRLRFLKSVCAGFGADPRAHRRLWREISLLSESKIAAQRKRREWKLSNYGRE